jgi:hypothetical protein
MFFVFASKSLYLVFEPFELTIYPASFGAEYLHHDRMTLVLSMGLLKSRQIAATAGYWLHSHFRRYVRFARQCAFALSFRRKSCSRASRITCLRLVDRHMLKNVTVKDSRRRAE